MADKLSFTLIQVLGFPGDSAHAFVDNDNKNIISRQVFICRFTELFCKFISMLLVLTSQVSFFVESTKNTNE